MSIDSRENGNYSNVIALPGLDLDKVIENLSDGTSQNITALLPFQDAANDSNIPDGEIVWETELHVPNKYKIITDAAVKKYVKERNTKRPNTIWYKSSFFGITDEQKEKMKQGAINIFMYIRNWNIK